MTDTMGNSEQETYFVSTRGQHAAPVQAVQASREETFSGKVRDAHAAQQSPNGDQAAGRSLGPVEDRTTGQPSAELMYFREIR